MPHRCLLCIIRTQEPKAPVTYCDHALSGVRPSSSYFWFHSEVKFLTHFLCLFFTLVILVSKGAKGENGVINVRGRLREKVNYRSKIVVITCTYISSTCLSKFLSTSVKTHKIL